MRKDSLYRVGSSMQAIILTRPLHCSQTSISMLKARFKRIAQVIAFLFSTSVRCDFSDIRL
jgi:hypothetical protein